MVSLQQQLFTGRPQQRDPPEHRKHDEHGPGSAQQRQDELLAADAGLLELGSRKLQASTSSHFQRRALDKP